MRKCSEVSSKNKFGKSTEKMYFCNPSFSTIVLAIFPEIFHLFCLQFLCRTPYVFDKCFSASDIFSRVFLSARACGCWRPARWVICWHLPRFYFHFRWPPKACFGSYFLAWPRHCNTPPCSCSAKQVGIVCATGGADASLCHLPPNSLRIPQKRSKNIKNNRTYSDFYCPNELTL